MPKLKNLSSDEIVKVLEKFGFEVVKQKGSHIKLARTGYSGKQILTIPYNTLNYETPSVDNFSSTTKLRNFLR